MFRKSFADFNPKAFVPLRPSDQRKLRETVADEFPVPQDVVELIVPEGLFSVKFESHSHVPGVAYLTSESVPLWFTIGKHLSNVVPTVYTLWNHPDLLPIISIPNKNVAAMLHATFLLDTKITFRPSVSLSVGQLVCITRDCDPTANGTPRVGPALAVGRMTLPSDLVEGGTKGKAADLLHAWKDHLWQMGGEEAPPRPRVLRDSLNGQDDDDGQQTDEEVEAAAVTRPETLKTEGTPKELSQEEVSDALRDALLESISATLSKLPLGSFPITSSIFHEAYILPYRSFQLTVAVGTPVDIKHSVYKSLTAFLKSSAKEGLIKVKEMKGGVVVTGVNGSHPSVRAHLRHVTIKDVETHKEKQEEVQAQEMGKADEQRRERQVTLLQKPGPVSAAFFQRSGRDPEELLTEEEIKTIVNQYLTSKRLFTQDPNFVNVAQDRLLLDTVLNGKEGGRAELLEKKVLNVNDVINRIVNSTKAWYKISNGDRQPIIREGKPNPISVNVAHRGSYTITCVSGFETFRLEADSLAEGLRIACASSTTVQPDPQKPELKQITVQGEHVELVAECLIARGVQRQWIEVVNRNRVKPKSQTGKRKPA